jgi:hypothetical protein
MARLGHPSDTHKLLIKPEIPRWRRAKNGGLQDSPGEGPPTPHTSYENPGDPLIELREDDVSIHSGSV